MKAAIFDMDGTLLDSMGMWTTLLPNYFVEQGVGNADTIIQEVERMSFKEAAAYMGEKYGFHKTPEQIYGELEDNIFTAYKTTIALKPYVREYLLKLHNEGIAMCIATLTDLDKAEAVTKRLGIYEFLSFILTVGEVKAGKDQPLIYERCVERLKVDKGDCHVFEDAPYAINTAKRAGFYVCGVHDDSQFYPDGFIEQNCDRFINSFAELLKK